jgi:hypothetical protein
LQAEELAASSLSKAELPDPIIDAGILRKDVSMKRQSMFSSRP